ncbi:hypothetical protein [Terrabacter sp. BE26]|uniref:hypothetical protein n=1 Tax=Terrabacter sp. BE26 TaxID=2898152 RepID=UPI0035BE70FB
MRNRRSFTVAGCVALATTMLVGPAASAETHHHASGDRGGQTTVVLNPDLLPVLTQTLKVRPIRPGQLTGPGGVARLSFPITEVEGKVIEHAGGLAFTTVGGGALRVTRFNVDLKTGFLNAKTVLDGTRLPGRVDIFALRAVKPIHGAIPKCDGTAAGLTLTPGAAKALGAPSFAGAFVGDACVAPEED